MSDLGTYESSIEGITLSHSPLRLTESLHRGASAAKAIQRQPLY